MPTFVLRCAYRFTRPRGGTVIDRHTIEADTIGEAVQLALIRCVDRRDLRLISAVLLGAEDRLAWTLELPDATNHYDALDDGLPPPGTA